MYRQKCWSLPLSLPLLFQFCVSFLTFSCSPHQHGASFEQQIGPTDEMQSKLISTIYVIYRYNSKNGNRNLVHVPKRLEFLYCLEGRGIFYLIIVLGGGGREEGGNHMVFKRNGWEKNQSSPTENKEKLNKEN